jgi:hypothetical protein
MKIAELRKKMAGMSKKEVVWLAAEFYKIIPKSTKKDHGVDDLINNPGTKKKKKQEKIIPLSDMDGELREFVKNARNQNYLAPNQVIPKRERSKWRFNVMRWYKELIHIQRPDADLGRQAKLLTDLYEVLCEAGDYHLFSTDDPFRSIQTAQIDFYKSILVLHEKSEGKIKAAEQGFRLMCENSTDRNTLFSELAETYIGFLTTPALKILAIENTEKQIAEIDYQPVKQRKSSFDFMQFNKDYKKERFNNEMAELGFRLHISLHETEDAIRFFKDHYHYHSEEVKVYVLVSLLFEFGLKDEIMKELHIARNNGVKLRDALLRLQSKIKKNNTLPEYMW